MKISFPIILCCNIMLLSACGRFSLSDLFPSTSAQTSPTGPGQEDSNYSQTIPIDTANRMILSYLHSIHYETNTNAIRSWSFNADTLRNYLNSQAGSHVTNIRFFLAHTMSYILGGHEGQQLPVNSHDLTIIIIGVDSTGSVVYKSEDRVFNHCLPCPDACYGGDLLTE